MNRSSWSPTFGPADPTIHFPNCCLIVIRTSGHTHTHWSPTHTRTQRPFWFSNQPNVKVFGLCEEAGGPGENAGTGRPCKPHENWAGFRTRTRTRSFLPSSDSLTAPLCQKFAGGSAAAQLPLLTCAKHSWFINPDTTKLSETARLIKVSLEAYRQKCKRLLLRFICNHAADPPSTKTDHRSIALALHSSGEAKLMYISIWRRQLSFLSRKSTPAFRIRHPPRQRCYWLTASITWRRCECRLLSCITPANPIMHVPKVFVH